MTEAKYNFYKSQEVDGKVYCHCVYEYKDKLKQLGFRWEQEVKLWYILEKKFTYDIFKQSQEIRYSNETTTGKIDYYYVYYKTKDDVINNRKQ